MIRWCIIIFAQFKLNELPTKNGAITIFMKPNNLVGWEDVCDILKVSFVGIRVINHEKMTITMEKGGFCIIWLVSFSYNLLGVFTHLTLLVLYICLLLACKLVTVAPNQVVKFVHLLIFVVFQQDFRTYSDDNWCLTSARLVEVWHSWWTVWFLAIKAKID